MQVEETIAFVVDEEPVGLEIRINFGVFAGRDATPAEIDNLAEQVLARVESVSIVAEERHEIDTQSEASVHQVRIEVAPESLPESRTEREQLAGRLIETAERWADACISERSVAIS